MIHPAWLGSVLHTAQSMGNHLVHAPIDPSSLISQGIGLGNQFLMPVTKSSLMTMGLGIIIIAVVYLVVLFVFISIALDLALTLIVTTALISISTFFLGFAALGATTSNCTPNLGCDFSALCKIARHLLCCGSRQSNDYGGCDGDSHQKLKALIPMPGLSRWSCCFSC